MTNKEALHDIKKSLKVLRGSREIVMMRPLQPQTVDKIIKVLEQEEPEPNDNCISRQAAWVRVTDEAGHNVWECDKCGWQQRFANNYCPDCGRKMMNKI